MLSAHSEMEHTLKVVDRLRPGDGLLIMALQCPSGEQSLAETGSNIKPNCPTAKGVRLIADAINLQCNDDVRNLVPHGALCFNKSKHCDAEKDPKTGRKRCKRMKKKEKSRLIRLFRALRAHLEAKGVHCLFFNGGGLLGNGDCAGASILIFDNSSATIVAEPLVLAVDHAGAFDNLGGIIRGTL